MPAATSPSPTLTIVNRIEGKIDKFVDDTTHFRENYAKAHQEVVDDTEQAHERINKLEKLIEKNTVEIAEMREAVAEVNRTIAPLVGLYKTLSILALAVGTTLIAFIWSIITHQITIGVP